METVKKRSELEKKDTWDLESMYATDALWEEDCGKVEQMLEEFQAFQGTLGTSPAHLKEALDRYYQMACILDNVYVYAQQRRDQDTADTYYQQMAMRSEDLMVKVESGSSFMNPEILSLTQEWVDRAMEEEEGLKFYERVLHEIFRMNAHTRSGEVEALLADAADLGNAPSNIFRMLENADMKYPKVKDEEGKEVDLTDSSLVPLLESKDRAVRKEAFETYYKVRDQYKNTFASIFSSNIKQAVFFAKARNYKTSRASFLDQGNIPESVYDNLIETVHKNLDSMYRYVRLRKKMLGVEELHMYDVYAPLVPECGREYSFEEAKAMVAEGLKPMGEEYLSILKEGFENRWIDVYENEGKRRAARTPGAATSRIPLCY